MKPFTKLITAAIAAAALIPATALADAQATRNQGYLVDTRGEIVRSGTGLCWHTSDWTPALAVEECDPAGKPVEAAAAPASKPAVAAVPPAAEPAKPSPQTNSISNEVLFEFDKSELKPQGKMMLDGLAQQLEGATYGTILAIGHADRIGSHKYNKKLSERRAQAVKDYLANKNIQAGRIDAQGKGETQPVTNAGDCLGGGNAKVIACLQPDRRVEIKVSGTRR